MPLSEATKEALRKQSIEDLLELNRFVVETVNMKQRQKAQAKLSEFHVGEIVSFRNRLGQYVSGRIKTINEKTVSLEQCSDSKMWRVHASYLEHGNKVPQPATVIGRPPQLQT